MEDCCSEQDLADCASTSTSDLSLSAQHPARHHLQNSTLLQEKNSCTSILLDNSLYMPCKCTAALLPVIHHCLILFIGAYHLGVLGP